MTSHAEGLRYIRESSHYAAAAAWVIIRRFKNPAPTCTSVRALPHRIKGRNKVIMDSNKLEHFRSILLAQLRQHSRHILEDQAAALELSDDGAKDSVDASWLDVNKEIAFRLGERESQNVADIDQALWRIKEGSYGMCARCGEPIDERRLEAVPTARYDAACQAAIEVNEGLDTNRTL